MLYLGICILVGSWIMHGNSRREGGTNRGIGILVRRVSLAWKLVAGLATLPIPPGHMYVKLSQRTKNGYIPSQLQRTWSSTHAAGARVLSPTWSATMFSLCELIWQLSFLGNLSARWIPIAQIQYTRQAHDIVQKKSFVYIIATGTL